MCLCVCLCSLSHTLALARFDAGERAAKAALVLPSVPEAMPRRERLQVPHDVRESPAADAHRRERPRQVHQRVQRTGAFVCVSVCLTCSLEHETLAGESSTAIEHTTLLLAVRNRSETDAVALLPVTVRSGAAPAVRERVPREPAAAPRHKAHARDARVQRVHLRQAARAHERNAVDDARVVRAVPRSHGQVHGRRDGKGASSCVSDWLSVDGAGSSLTCTHEHILGLVHPVH